MTILRRIASFYSSNGLASTLARCLEAGRRVSYGGGMALFSCRLPIDQLASNTDTAVQRFDANTLPHAVGDPEFSIEDLAISSAVRSARFGAGSELWLARRAGQLAGYGWTVQGRTIEPHFFPIRPDEVHLFDFFVLPEFRGQGVNGDLMAEILTRLGDEGIHLAHIECATWNNAQLRSLSKSFFRMYAIASKVTVWGRPVVIWHRRRHAGAEPDST